MNSKGYTILVCLFLTVLTLGCSSDDGPGPPPPPDIPEETVPIGQVRIINGDTLAFNSLDGDILTLSFEGTASDIDEGIIINENDIVVGQGNGDGGFLKRVESYNLVNDTTIVVHTSGAYLADALGDETASGTFSIPGPVILDPPPADGVVLNSSSFFEFEDVEIFNESANTALITHGSLEFTPALTLEFTVADSSLTEFRAIVQDTFILDAQFVFEVDSLFHRAPAPIHLASASKTCVLMVREDSLPVVAVVTYHLYAGCIFDFNEEASVEFFGKSHVSVEEIIQYNGTVWSTSLDIAPEENTGGLDIPAFSQDGASVFFQIQIEIDFYAENGPEFVLEPYVEFGGETDYEENWCADLFLGFNGYGLDFSASILDSESAASTGDTTTSYEDIIYSECHEGEGIQIESNPTGAAISIDGLNTGLVTPKLLKNIAPGTHTLKLSLPDHCSYFDSFNYDGNLIDFVASMQLWEPPSPIFEIDNLTNGQSVDDNIVTLTGLLQRVDHCTDGRTAFNGESAIITLNDVEQLVGVEEDGTFSTKVGIQLGENILTMKATSSDNVTGYSDTYILDGDFTPKDLVVFLNWDNAYSDLDLHIWNPNHEHCYYGNLSVSDGFLDSDDSEGYGPEIFTAENALNGTYTFMINSFSLNPNSSTEADVTVFLDGNTFELFGPHPFLIADGNGLNPDAWWSVLEFTYNSETKSLDVSPVDSDRMEMIRYDMSHLPHK